MSKNIGFFVVLFSCLVCGPAAGEASLSEAVAAQRALTEDQPGNATLFNDLGNLLLLLGEEREAEDAYRRALQIDGELLSAHFNLALLLQQTYRPTKARREFKQLLKIDPENAWSHYQIGVLDARRGKRDAAIRSYARALRIEPRLTDPAFNPHILDNTLAASATLKAYADVSSAHLVPRTYESPRRIAGILVPEISGETTRMTKAERRRLRRQKKATPTDSPASPALEDQEARPAPKPPLRKDKPPDPPAG